MYKGIALSVAASCLFGILYYFPTLLHPLTGEEIFGWRMLMMLPCVTIMLRYTNDWPQVVELYLRLRARPFLLPGMAFTSALLGVQLWLFLWAPMNGRALSVSLGYFLMPLSMLLIGQILYRERLSAFQKWATLFATIGAANELYHNGSLSWETALVALGYPLYFIARRKLGTDNIGGMWFDMLLLTPAAVWFALSKGEGLSNLLEAPRLCYLLLILAILSAVAFTSYISASKFLPFGLFGLLGYVEPVLMVGVALAIGEQIKSSQWLTYVPIWIAVLILVLEGVIYLSIKRMRGISLEKSGAR